MNKPNIDKLNLQDFIKKVKEELQEAVSEGKENPFFKIGDVELEVSFIMEFGVNGKLDFKVISLGGDTNSSQIHKVKLTLTPFIKEKEDLPQIKYLSQRKQKTSTRYDNKPFVIVTTEGTPRIVDDRPVAIIDVDTRPVCIKRGRRKNKSNNSLYRLLNKKVPK